ncbi:Nuclear transport receptor RANBP7/RANBP8 (importin beta superfamily) [Ceraceosorus bombacis]|uniref:Nuclear transport receptor RANBP7/RANBP8 (Importin beta superfamily) n=1 Tax=Ceraceosorus bombacis TaxID=401625 RepID=A0A0P1BKJ4_9BASI|nr:Nuclear transport receptor RANBP7/RANBP8 (importin beta superfamily) [Ceraceosorus bombacis]
MEQLYNLFASSFDANPNHRLAAELELRKLEQQDGMLATALQIVAHPELDIAGRQAAAIYVKNRARRMWDHERAINLAKAGGGAAAGGPSNNVPIGEKDRQEVRSNILQTLISSPPPLRSHVAATLNAIVTTDFPKSWPDLIDRISELLNSGDQNATYGGVCALLEVVRSFRWKDESSLLEPVSAATLPRLVATGQSILASPTASSAQSGELLWKLVKVYKLSINSQLTAHHQSHQSIVPWGQLFIAIVKHQVDPSQLPADEDERERAPWTKAKKWSFFNLNKLFTRYGNPSQLPQSLDKYKPFAEHFVSTFAPRILEVYLELTVARLNSGLWLSKKAHYFIIAFYEDCVKPKSTWLLLKPHVDDLVQRFVFPLMCYTEADEELWELDAVDYVRSHLDPIEEFGTPQGAAASFLQALISKRTKSTFHPQLQFITSVIQTRTNNEKEGALNMLVSISDTILESSEISNQLETLFVTSVIPELASGNRFLRFRACDLVRVFAGTMRWQDTTNLESTFKGVMQCLEDGELPVRMQAAAAIGTLIDHDEVHAAMAPNAGPLMQRLLKLADETDLDTLSATTSKVVSSFAEQILPFAVEFCQHLRDSYIRVLGEHLANADAELNNINGELDYNPSAESKMFAAVAACQTMYQVLAAADENQQLLGQLETVILPVVSYTLEKECVELYDDVLDLTDVIVFNQKRVSEGMWSIFVQLHTTFKASGIDYLSEMLPTLDNIVSYGTEVIKSQPDYRRMLLEIFEIGMTNENLGVVDRVSALKLIDVALLLLTGTIDEAVPGIVQMTLPHVKAEGRESSASLRKWSKLVILDAFVYNPALALKSLETHNAAASFLNTIITDVSHFGNVHSRKVVASAFCGIFALPRPSLANDVQALLPQLLAATIEVLEGLPQAIAERKEQLELFDDLDEDEVEEAEEESATVHGGASAGDDADGDVVDEENESIAGNIQDVVAALHPTVRAQLEQVANGVDEQVAKPHVTPVL